jgi:hypothetical protein
MPGWDLNWDGWLYKAAVAVLILFAFFHTFACGLHGYQPNDAGMYFDGGYRIFRGQIPFRDFYIPVGPGLFFMVAAFFKLFGVSYHSYIGLSASINALITILTLAIGRRLCQDRILVLAAGLVSAVWNVPVYYPFPWHDTGAFLFLFTALWLMTSTSSSSRPGLIYFLAGVSAAAAFFNKQSTGAAGGFFLLLYLMQSGRRSGALWYLSGGGCGFIAWLSLCILPSSADTVMRYLFLVPFGHGQGLSSGHQLGMGVPLSAAIFIAGTRHFKPREWWLWVPTSIGLAVALLTYGYSPSRFLNACFFIPLLALAFMQEEHDRALLMALVMTAFVAKVCSFQYIFDFLGFIGIELLLFWKALKAWMAARPVRSADWGLEALESRHFRSAVIASSAAFAVGFGLRTGLRYRLGGYWEFPMATFLIAAVAWAAGAVLLCRAVWPRRNSPSLKRMALGCACLMLGLLGIFRTERSYARKISEPWDVCPETWIPICRIPALNGLTLDPKDVVAMESLVSYLKALPPWRKPVFIYKQFSVLYAAIAQVPPQPFAWFAKDLGYRLGPPDEPRLCTALERNQVGTVVAYDDAQTDLAEIPCLGRFVASRFAPTRRFGNFQVYSRRSP